jgi:hypothetical protein
MMLKMMEDKENRSTTWRNEAIIFASFSFAEEFSPFQPVSTESHKKKHKNRI